jgi:hypothetical protein
MGFACMLGGAGRTPYIVANRCTGGGADALDAGVRQVAVVGAGYDTRAWRFRREGVLGSSSWTTWRRSGTRCGGRPAGSDLRRGRPRLRGRDRAPLTAAIVPRTNSRP